MNSTKRSTRGALPLTLLAQVTIALGGLTLVSSPASAAESDNYGIRPSDAADHFRTELAPGAASRHTAIVSNRTDKTITFKIYPADALTTEQGGFALRSQDEPQNGVGQWASLPLETVTLRAGTEKAVPFRLAVPADATPGDYAGGIILEAPPREGTPGEVGDQTAVQLNVIERVGVRIYLRVSGTARADLRVGELTTRDTDDGAIRFTLPITNTGNVILNPEVSSAVVAKFGGRKELTFTQVESLLPGQTATVRATWRNPPSLIWARVNAAVTYEGGTEHATTNVRRVPVVPALILLTALALALWLSVRAIRTVRAARRVLRQQTAPANGEPVGTASLHRPLEPSEKSGALERGRHARHH